MKYKIIFLSASLLFSATYSLTVRDALVAAYKNNKDLQLTRQAVIAKHESIVQAKGGFRPQVSAQISDAYTEAMNKTDATDIHQYSTGKNRSASVTASQNLFKGGADLAYISKTEHDIANAWAQLQDKEQEVFFNVIKAYLNLYAKCATVEMYKANLAFTKQQFDAASAKRQIGEETITQESSTEAKYMDALAKLEAGLADLAAAKAEFEQLTGMTAPEFVDHPKELINVPNSGEILQEITLKDNPKMTQAYETLSSSKQDKNMKTGALLPSLDIKATTSKTMARNKRENIAQTGRSKTLEINNQVGLTLSIPLYDAGVNRSQRRQASETVVQNRINIDKTKQELVNACKRVYSAYLAAKANMVSTAKQVKAQEVAVDGITQEMTAGTKTMVEVLYAQSQLLEAKLALITATQNYYTYLYQILSLQGKLTATSLELPVEIFDPKRDYEEVSMYF